MAGGTDGSETARVVEAALNSEDSDVVRAALLEGVRAAVDAVDDAVIPSIGLLTRRRLRTGTPDLRRYRELLSLLRTLDAEEFRALRTVIERITTMMVSMLLGYDRVLFRQRERGVERPRLTRSMIELFHSIMPPT